MADVGKIKTVYSLGQRPRKQNLLLFMLAKCFLRSAHTHYERSQSTLLLNCKVVCESHARDFECLAGLCCCNRHRGLVAEPADVCLSRFWGLRSPRSRCRVLLRALPGLHVASFLLRSHMAERMLAFLPLRRTPVPSWEPRLRDLTKPTSQRPHL